MKTGVLGGFDGIHIGHRRLIEAAGNDPVVVCMEPLPRQLTAEPGWARRLTTPSERRKALHDMGIMSIITLPFHRGLMACPPGEFPGVLRQLVDIERVAVGWDFRYGRDRKGDAETLASSLKGIEVIVVPPCTREGRPVKSELIRSLIGQGKLPEAEELLGRAYNCLGVVARGRGRGKSLGFPTMNVTVPGCKLLPPPGSYAVKVQTGGTEYYGAAFRQPGKSCVEVHIPGFRGENYGHRAEVVFGKALRKPENTDTDRKLMELINRDVNAAMEVAEKWR